jgi:predicted  nucleic acid-binding Zn-ribbon protein
MENKDKKEITLNELATVVKAGFEAVDKRIDAKFEAADKRTDAKIEKLAEMVGKGFNEMGERIDEIKQEVSSMKGDINSLKQGQERIEMRLNNVVYRSELDAVLDRVQVLEKQMKIALKSN